MSFFKKNFWIIILSTLLIATSAIKVAEVYNGNFPFTTDQGRDMVDIRHMVVTHTPRLVGPTTSINGVLLGPFWYYFNLIPFIAGGGDPSYIVYWQILWYQISVITLWLVLKRKNANLAGIISLILLLMPTGFNAARYFWNANSMPIFTALYFAALIWALSPDVIPAKAGIHKHQAASRVIPGLTRNLYKSLNFKLFTLGLISGLAMQVEAAFGILLFPFAFIYLLYCHPRSRSRLGDPDRESMQMKLKKTIPLIFGFGLTLLPQILFELKHGFIMTKILINEIIGRGGMLGEKINFSERLIQRKEHLLDLIQHSSHLPPNTILGLFILALIVYIISHSRSNRASKKNNTNSNYLDIWTLSFFFILFSAIFYLLFPQKLKIWYTLGFSIPLAIFIGSFFNYLFERKLFIFKLMAIGLLIMTVFYSLKSQVDYTRDVASKVSDDRSNMKNELSAIDWVYENAAGRGFNVYSYLPSVYDFPYNHLFWWYGSSKYGYEPAETAYLPGQPEYIRDVDKLWTKKKPVDLEYPITFLIIEEDFDMPERTEAWLGNFAHLCIVKKEVFPWHAQVRMLTSNCLPDN